MLPGGPVARPSTPEAEAFVRFCYQRRRVGWPELYDEMCAVATRGLYQGMGHDDLAEIGVGFSLFETPRLAQLVQRIVAEDHAARRAARTAACTASGTGATTATSDSTSEVTLAADTGTIGAEPVLSLSAPAA